MASCSGHCISSNAAAAAKAIQTLLSEQKIVRQRLHRAEAEQLQLWSLGHIEPLHDEDLTHNKYSELSPDKDLKRLNTDTSKLQQLHVDYVEYLSRKLQQLEASELAARELHKVLHRSKMPYLEKHKLLAVQKIRSLT